MAKKEQTKPQGNPVGIDWDKEQEVSLPEIDGWYAPEKGEEPVQGKVLGAMQVKGLRDGEMRTVVLVKLLVPHLAAEKGGQTVALSMGQVMAVQIRAKLDPLLDYVEHQGYVWFQATDKKNIGNGQTMWQFKVKAKGQKGRRPTFGRPANEPGASNDTDDIPF